MASTSEVAKDLVELCRRGANLEAVDKYYSTDIVSVESASMPGIPAETKGLEAIQAKNKWWMENHEIHDAQASDAFVNGGDQFAVRFTYDVTNKPSGQRMKMDEMALYTVKNGKIVHEHFFYKTGA